GAVTVSILLIGTSPSAVVRSMVAALVRDWEEWNKARIARAKETKETRVKETKAPVVAPREELSKSLPKSQPKIMNLPSETPAPAQVTPSASAEPRITRKTEAPAPKPQP